MIVFPAIDLVDGQVVRLSRGERSRMDVYSDDPVAVAEDFVERRQEAAGRPLQIVADRVGEGDRVARPKRLQHGGVD